MTNKNVVFANLTCRFGDKFVLLDLAQEIVIPAFLDETLVRMSGQDTAYFFYEQTLKAFENVLDAGSSEPLLVVYGRFIKDTVLRRTQVFSPSEGLVPDEEAIKSAPSAFFAFILNNHKLIYLPETPHAPALGAFRTTINNFFRNKHWAYINALHADSKASAEPVPKKHLLIEYPPPTVELLPLASRASIEEFLFTFQTLTRFELQIIDTNQELQGSDLYRKIRQVRADLKARRTTLAHESRDGLDKQEAVDQIHAGAATGNQNVRIVGKSADGSVISGNNHNVRLRVPLEGIAEEPQRRAKQLVEVYANQVEQGVLSKDVAEPDVEKLREIREKLQ